MNAPLKVLADDVARQIAIATHDRSLLVEAGAGSGKTAVMAGRVAMMLAEGISPKSIVAVTFTELAASELLVRVRDFVADLVAGEVPREMRIAIPGAISPIQMENLKAASALIDEVTCSTIHGFCQALIKPYPVEANIDPGATIMDPNEGDLSFREILDTWLRRKLSTDDSVLISEMVLHDPKATVTLIENVLGHMRKRRTIVPPAVTSHIPLIKNFRAAVAAYDAFLSGAPVKDPATVVLLGHFKAMANDFALLETNDSYSVLIGYLTNGPHDDLCIKSGSFTSYKKKGKWVEAAKRASLAKGEGERLSEEATRHHTACCAAWGPIREAVASRILADLIDTVRPVAELFQAHKRNVGKLDFDDLIFAARDLLKGHPAVREALAQRYSRVLVDEFQDTDPLQTEIFWRLCGDPPIGAPDDDWSAFLIRPGALFLVGDPKQAIYRFRGADIAAYMKAYSALKALDGESVLSISTNFRSRAPILAYVNARFEKILSMDGQPGFTKLDAFHIEDDGAKCVVALDVTIPGGGLSPTSGVRRDAEAEAVAQMCARLIGKHQIIDRKSGVLRACRPGDIALLAPTGTELWRYEIALESYRIPVATQAGKGLYRRQEIQDLIALTRVLSDGRDTLALGALLRGPLVGLTDEELLDIVWGLPRSADRPDDITVLTLSVDLDRIQHPLARDVLAKLRSLRLKANSTHPHEILSQAIDTLRVRPILMSRHHRQAERALSNVDLYLSFARAYSVRGLKAFAEAMTTSWEDEERAVEGRPDAQEESVALYTMHASKGLEWPIVVPINTMTHIWEKESAVISRDTEQFYCPVFRVPPIGHGDVREAELVELRRERVRLWYVATTRAREMLVIPRANIPDGDDTWMSLIEFALDDLPALDLSHVPADVANTTEVAANTQTREQFAKEGETIFALQRKLTWLAPSRDEGELGPVMQVEPPALTLAGEDNGDSDGSAPANVQGGRKRGLIIHKLFEEVLTGETVDSLQALTERATILIHELGSIPMQDASKGLSSDELAGCVTRTLALPEIVTLRPTLIPEMPVFSTRAIANGEQAIVGIADATSYTHDGKPQTVVDWKSDVAADSTLVDHYRSQVRTYLESTGAKHGIIVFVTSGDVVRISQPVTQ